MTCPLLTRGRVTTYAGRVKQPAKDGFVVQVNRAEQLAGVVGRKVMAEQTSRFIYWPVSLVLVSILFFQSILSELSGSRLIFGFGLSGFSLSLLYL